MVWKGFFLKLLISIWLPGRILVWRVVEIFKMLLEKCLVTWTRTQQKQIFISVKNLWLNLLQESQNCHLFQTWKKPSSHGHFWTKVLCETENPLSLEKRFLQLNEWWQNENAKNPTVLKKNCKLYSTRFKELRIYCGIICWKLVDGHVVSQQDGQLVAKLV